MTPAMPARPGEIGWAEVRRNVARDGKITEGRELYEDTARGDAFRA